MRKGIVTAMLLVGLLIAAAPASAAVSSVDSATDQYVEYIPEAVGREDGENGRGTDRGSQPGSVPEKQIQRLERQGPEGAAAAALAEMTAPPTYPGTGTEQTDDEGSSNDSQRAEDDSSSTRPASPAQLGVGTETSGVTAVLSNVGGAGMGVLLPLLMLLGALGVLWLRITGSHRGPGADD